MYTVERHLHNNPVNIRIIIQFVNFVDKLHFRRRVRKLHVLGDDSYVAGRFDFHFYVDVGIFPAAYLNDSETGREVG